MKRALWLMIVGSLCLGTSACEVYRVKPTDPKVAALAEPAHDKDDVQDADGHWTCPHEGGDYKHPGKCPNKWCGLDLVPLKKKK